MNIKQFGINPNQIGFYNDENFISQESQNPRFLNEYNYVVTNKVFDDKYLDNARKRIPLICNILFTELKKTGYTQKDIFNSFLASNIGTIVFINEYPPQEVRFQDVKIRYIPIHAGVSDSDLENIKNIIFNGNKTPYQLYIEKIKIL